MGFFSKLFKSKSKENSTDTASLLRNDSLKDGNEILHNTQYESNDDALQSNDFKAKRIHTAFEYMQSKLSKGNTVSVQDRFVMDIIKEVAEKQFAKQLKDELKLNINITYDANCSDIDWNKTFKYSCIWATLEKIKNGVDDVSVMLVVGDIADDDLEDYDEEESYIVLYDDSITTDDDYEVADIDEKDESEIDRVPLDTLVANCHTTNQIYEIAAQKVKESLIKLGII